MFSISTRRSRSMPMLASSFLVTPLAYRSGSPRGRPERRQPRARTYYVEGARTKLIGADSYPNPHHSPQRLILCGPNGTSYKMTCNSSTAELSRCGVYRSTEDLRDRRNTSRRATSCENVFRTNRCYDVGRVTSSNDVGKATSSNDVCKATSCNDLYRATSCNDVCRATSSNDVSKATSCDDVCRATSCDDVCRATSCNSSGWDCRLSESGVYLNDSRTDLGSSYAGLEDVDAVSQCSFGSSLAFHEMTGDSELDSATGSLHTHDRSHLGDGGPSLGGGRRKARHDSGSREKFLSEVSSLSGRSSPTEFYHSTPTKRRSPVLSIFPADEEDLNFPATISKDPLPHLSKDLHSPDSSSTDSQQHPPPTSPHSSPPSGRHRARSRVVRPIPHHVETTPDVINCSQQGLLSAGPDCPHLQLHRAGQNVQSWLDKEHAHHHAIADTQLSTDPTLPSTDHKDHSVSSTDHSVSSNSGQDQVTHHQTHRYSEENSAHCSGCEGGRAVDRHTPSSSSSHSQQMLSAQAEREAASPRPHSTEQADCSTGGEPHSTTTAGPATHSSLLTSLSTRGEEGEGEDGGVSHRSSASYTAQEEHGGEGGTAPTYSQLPSIPSDDVVRGSGVDNKPSAGVNITTTTTTTTAALPSYRSTGLTPASDQVTHSDGGEQAESSTAHTHCAQLDTSAVADCVLSDVVTAVSTQNEAQDVTNTTAVHPSTFTRLVTSQSRTGREQETDCSSDGSADPARVLRDDCQPDGEDTDERYLQEGGSDKINSPSSLPRTQHRRRHTDTALEDSIGADSSPPPSPSPQDFTPAPSLTPEAPSSSSSREKSGDVSSSEAHEDTGNGRAVQNGGLLVTDSESRPACTERHHDSTLPLTFATCSEEDLYSSSDQLDMPRDQHGSPKVTIREVGRSHTHHVHRTKVQETVTTLRTVRHAEVVGERGEDEGGREDWVTDRIVRKTTVKEEEDIQQTTTTSSSRQGLKKTPENQNTTDSRATSSIHSEVSIQLSSPSTPTPPPAQHRDLRVDSSEQATDTADHGIVGSLSSLPAEDTPCTLSSGPSEHVFHADRALPDSQQPTAVTLTDSSQRVRGVSSVSITLNRHNPQPGLLHPGLSVSSPDNNAKATDWKTDSHRGERTVTEDAGQLSSHRPAPVIPVMSTSFKGQSASDEPSLHHSMDIMFDDLLSGLHNQSLTESTQAEEDESEVMDETTTTTSDFENRFNDLADDLSVPENQLWNSDDLLTNLSVSEDRTSTRSPNRQDISLTSSADLSSKRTSPHYSSLPDQSGQTTSRQGGSVRSAESHPGRGLSDRRLSSTAKPSKKSQWVEQTVHLFQRLLNDFVSQNPISKQSLQHQVMDVEAGHRDDDLHKQSEISEDLYRSFTREFLERRQNHVCPVIEDHMPALRFQRFLRKKHNSKLEGQKTFRIAHHLDKVAEASLGPEASSTLSTSEPSLVRSTLSPHLHHHHKLSPGRQRGRLLSDVFTDDHDLSFAMSSTDSAYSSLSGSLSHRLSHLHSSFQSLASSHADVSSVATDLSLDGEGLTSGSDHCEHLDLSDVTIDEALLDRLRAGHYKAESV